MSEAITIFLDGRLYLDTLLYYLCLYVQTMLQCTMFIQYGSADLLLAFNLLFALEGFNFHHHG